MTPTLRIVLACTALFAAAPVFADAESPAANCRKPIKPFPFDSINEIDQFNEDVLRYKRCITDFVAAQTAAAQAHQEAARVAIEEWNEFVNVELKK
jgi:hypothetical protein